jgi:hypothetical protein
MTKRNLFAELVEGCNALQDAREGKAALPTAEADLEIAPVSAIGPPSEPGIASGSK